MSKMYSASCLCINSNNTVRFTRPKIIAYFCLSNPPCDEIIYIKKSELKKYYWGQVYFFAITFRMYNVDYFKAFSRTSKIRSYFSMAAFYCLPVDLKNYKLVPTTSITMNNILFQNSSPLSKLCWY